MKEEYAMKIMKATVRVDRHGLLIISATDAGFTPGDEVHLVIAEPEEGESPILLLTPEGVGVAVPMDGLANDGAENDEDDGLNIPKELLEEAGIPCGSELEIICGEGSLLVQASDTSEQLPKELAELFQELGIHPDTVREIMKKEGYLV